MRIIRPRMLTLLLVVEEANLLVFEVIQTNCNSEKNNEQTFNHHRIVCIVYLRILGMVIYFYLMFGSSMKYIYALLCFSNIFIEYVGALANFSLSR